MGHAMVDMIADYYESLPSLPRVSPDVQPGFLRGALPPNAPEQPESFEAVMADVRDKLMPGVVHWQSPSFFAYFPSNYSFPAALADMWSSVLGMVGFSWAAGPVATELEMAMMDWLADLCGLPPAFKCNGGAGPGGGVIQGTTSEAVVVALLAARARALAGRPVADRLKLVAYSSDQAHSCFKKACMIAGMDHVRLLPASAEHDWALQPEALKAAIEADVAAGLIPCFVMASVGTTSSCAVDPVAQLAAAAAGSGAWFHVDAAYAGSAALLPEHRHHFAGLGAVDSYSFNPHKWLLTNFDCCCMWVADSGPLKEALSLTPVFLRAAAGNSLDYKDWQIPLGRKFRSLKLYFLLRMYGAEKLRSYLRHHIALAGAFAQQVAADPRFELAAPQRFGLVCFRLRGVPREVNAALLAALNASGRLFLIHTELGGAYTLRLAVGAATSQLEHVQAAWAAVSAAADQVLAEHGVAAAAAAAAGKEVAAAGAGSGAGARS
ncbi:hypothetical protein HYH02_005790 [Chlamydomonas schloesseri]|uniref:Aromatic-L-amino-acid decarboxylase n=1 Tax=Chlamydomonas schloesseri TaxID=2026947 RepID=A0A835WJW4_9CHLO|nr:hypothetical protein HYH02_005790 [Chlamydomonas schloesseri]|eukprot:KAG2449038.1 hypothetical protein HYH02_005790 [Chlamydomonas schloesseri]